MLIRLYAFLFTCCLGVCSLSSAAAQCAINILSTVPATCTLPNGSVTLQVTGGVSPYAYSVNGGSNIISLDDIFTIPNLPANPYTININDGSGCTATTTFTIVASLPLVLNAQVTNVTCFGGNDGAVEIVATGGTPPYLYAWSNDIHTQNQSNLSADNYSVTVTDANGCTKATTIVLSQPPPIFLTTTATNVPCQGGTTGALNLNVQGGTGAYSYDWSNDGPENPDNDTKDLVGLAAGTYTVTVTDARACTATTSAIVSPASTDCASIGDFVWNDLDGDGLQDAGEPGIPGVAVTLTGTPGSGTPVNMTTTTNALGNYLFPNLTPGTYTLTFTTPVNYAVSPQDQGGNDATDSEINLAGVTPSEVLTSGENNLTYDAGFYQIMHLTTVPTALSCTGSGTGAIDLIVIGGLMPITYVWNNGVTTQDITNLDVGNYTVTATDASGYTQVATATVSPFVPIELSIVANTPCASSSIDLTVSGGSAPYIYVWSNGHAAPNLTQLPAGTYTVTVYDAHECTATTSVEVTAPAEMSLVTAVSHVLCFGQNSGAINLTVNAGVSPYTHTWSNGATTEDLSGLVAGTYTVTVTDAIGCTALATVSISQSSGFTLSTTLTNALCGAANGTINIVTIGGTPPYAYLWSNGSTTQNLTNLIPGTYSLTITDATGCTKTINATVNESSSFAVNTFVTEASCGNVNGTISVDVTGGTPNYSYVWTSSNGSTGSASNIVSEPFTLSNLSAGNYSITITDGNGCTKTTSVIVNGTPAITATPTITYTNCASATVSIEVTGGSGAYTYLWSNGSPLAVFETSGTYYVTVTDVNGCFAVAAFTINLGVSSLCGTIAGRVLRDTIENCQTDAEPGLANWIVKASGATTYYSMTDSTGQYHLAVESGATYTLSVVPPNALWAPCPLVPTVTVSQPGDTLPANDILVQKTATCPALTVSIAAGLLRRCFTGSYTVNYCNEGTAPAEDAYVLVQLDAYLSIQSATIPFINLGNGLLRFNIGHLDIGACGSFKIYVQVSCNATLGQTHCTEAHIYPDGNCLPPNPLWSGASLEMHSNCGPDSLRFVIKNVGTGDLSETVNYIVIEDQVMLMQALVPPLSAGDSVQISFPANGSTWRVEVRQAAFHPGESQPSLAVEGCSSNGTFSTGFVSQFPADDADPWIDIDCTANTGSYDPNDKEGFPIGYGTEHYIRPNGDLEYRIRFQNTGTDTAFTVVVVDTLSAWLDPATIHPGPASHPYRFELYGPGIVKFHFENILLPDSSANEAASHGFAQFRISPHADAPLETRIENQAAIYFDFNAPVFTNTTFHRLGEQFVTTSLWQPQVVGAKVIVSPNPFDQQARLEVKGMTTNNPLQLQVFDLQGNKVREMTSSTTSFLLKKGDWPAGVYLFRISEKGRLVGSGKLMIQ